MDVAKLSGTYPYANSWFSIQGRPLLRFTGRNIVELIFLCISAIGTPITILTIIIIITKSPPQMKKYQWILLNLTVTVFLTDLTICYIFDPLPLFPEIACYSETWLANVAEDAIYVLFCISILLLQFSFCGTLVAFIHRLNALRPLPETLEYLLHWNGHRITAIVYIVGNIPLIVVLITSYRIREEMEAVVESKPQLRFLKGYGSYLATEEYDHKFTEFQVVWSTLAILMTVLCGIIAVTVIVNLRRKKHFMSQRTLELHRYLAFHLIVQSVTPAVSVIIPMLILFSTRYFHVPFGAPFWNAAISQTVALHSPVNTVAILFATKHYRKALLKPFKRVFGGVFGKKIASNVSSRVADTPTAWQNTAAPFRFCS